MSSWNLPLHTTLLTTDENSARRAALEQQNRRKKMFQSEKGNWFQPQHEEGTYAEYCQYRNEHRHSSFRNDSFPRS